MGTFFKTFFVCLFLTLGLIGYKYFFTDSYSLDLKTSSTSAVFGTHENYQEAQSVKTPENVTSQVQKNNSNNTVEETPNVPKKYIHKCYFYSHNGQLITVSRELSMNPTLETSINLLLKGPTINETKKGIFSEIPANVDLIKIDRTDNKVIVDLTSNFGNGGGSNSIINRIKQLSKTVKLYEPYKDVYLYIDGQEIEYLGGDGVFIKQPL